MRRVDPWLLLGLILAALLLFLAVYGERIAPYEPTYSLLRRGPGDVPPYAPDGTFRLGSDNAGRDLLSLVLAGARTTLALVVAAGLARLLLGLALAIAVSRRRPAGLLVDGVADVVGAVPSTLVAVLVVLVFFGPSAQATVFIAALALTGWTGPYRIARAELGRLRAAPFTEAAQVLGVRLLAILMRHHLPHLVPVLAHSATQQVVASLVAVAELGTLGLFVGPWRVLEPVIQPGRFGAGGSPILVPQLAEWGGMLANGRTLENLYVSRWVFLVPAVAIAAAAIGFSVLGVGLARHYARRNLFREIRWRGVLALALIVALAVAPSFVLPDRYPGAAALAASARTAVTDREFDALEVEREFAELGLAAIGGGYPLERTAMRVEQTGASRLRIRTPDGEVDLREGWARDADYAPVLFAGSGGGVVDAPVVFAGWGIAPSDYRGEFGDAIGEWADDYAAVDVRGKIALILQLPLTMVTSGGFNRVATPGFDVIAANVVRRGAVGIMYVDRLRGSYGADPSRNPYSALARAQPPTRPSGMPALVVDLAVADRLLLATGPSASEIYRTPALSIARTSHAFFASSLARALPASARIELPAELVTSRSRSLVASLGDVSAGALMIWAIAPSRVDGSRDAARALLAVLRGVAKPEEQPALVVVLFDPRGDADENAMAVRERLRGIPIRLLLALDALQGRELRFFANQGSLLSIADHYAAKAGVPHAPTLDVATPTWPTGLRAFNDVPTILARGDAIGGSRAGDAAAFVAYAVGRFMARSPELRR